MSERPPQHGGLPGLEPLGEDGGDGAIPPLSRSDRRAWGEQVVAEVARRRRRRRRRWQVGVAMAAVLFGVSGASAVVWLTEKGGDGSPARRAVEPTPDASAAAAQGPAATPDASAPDAGRGPQADAGTRGKSRQKVDSGAKVAEPSPVRQPEPRDLLRRANRLRKAQRWRAAERAYGAVAGRHPGSRSAHVARVAAASLRLEKLGDPRGALELYRAVLRRRPEGNLAAEARYGVAEALRALGDRSGEARALEQFLEAHPDNALAGAARQRLRELR